MYVFGQAGRHLAGREAGRHRHRYRHRCRYRYRFMGLRSPAAGPLSWVPEHRWMVIAGWGPLAFDCLLVPVGWWRGRLEAGRWTSDGLNTTPREARKGYREPLGSLPVPWSSGRIRAGTKQLQARHGQFDCTLCRALGTMAYFRLRAQLFWAIGRSCLTLVQRNCPRPSKGQPIPVCLQIVYFAWTGNSLRAVQVHLLLTLVTCHFHLSPAPVTCASCHLPHVLVPVTCTCT